LAIDDSEEIAMPLGVEVRIVFFKTFTISFKELVKTETLLDLRYPDFPEHKCIDWITTHDRVEEDAYLRTTPSKFPLNGGQQVTPVDDVMDRFFDCYCFLVLTSHLFLHNQNCSRV
jgi:hypothetical protein